MQPDSCATIEHWLEAIDVSVLSTAAPTSGLVLQVNNDNLPPNTPRQLTNQIIEETSPTNTSFSATTIFDTPVHKRQHSSHDPLSDYDSLDVYSENTTVYNEGDKEAVAEEEDAPDWEVTTSEAITPDDAITLNTGTDEASYLKLETLSSSELHGQEEMVRIVSLTSCLQCIHLHLPCSRTYPHCTRCMRNGHADLCLLHRRRFASEFGHGGGPVLLKVKGEDEEVQRRKLELREAMGEEWVAEQDRKNWVLPNPLGETSGWHKRGVWVDEGKGYPREGEGRVVLRELVIELEN